MPDESEVSGRIRFSQSASTTITVMKSAGRVPSRNNKAQKGAENHWGTTKETTALDHKHV